LGWRLSLPSIWEQGREVLRAIWAAAKPDTDSNRITWSYIYSYLDRNGDDYTQRNANSDTYAQWNSNEHS
jgi:hypothetical protein